MRIRVSNADLPGFTSERTMNLGSELHREAIFDPEGEYIGEVIYVARKVKQGTDYGWLPAKAARQSKLTSKLEAIKRLPRFSQ